MEINPIAKAVSALPVARNPSFEGHGQSRLRLIVQSKRATIVPHSGLRIGPVLSSLTILRGTQCGSPEPSLSFRSKPIPDCHKSAHWRKANLAADVVKALQDGHALRDPTRPRASQLSQTLLYSPASRNSHAINVAAPRLPCAAAFPAPAGTSNATSPIGCSLILTSCSPRFNAIV